MPAPFLRWCCVFSTAVQTERTGSIKVNNACGIVVCSLLRCPADILGDKAPSSPADRCHSLRSLYPPQAALPSLPLRYVISRLNRLQKKNHSSEWFFFYYELQITNYEFVISVRCRGGNLPPVGSGNYELQITNYELTPHARVCNLQLTMARKTLSLRGDRRSTVGASLCAAGGR